MLSDSLFSLLFFILRNFFWIVGGGVLLVCVGHILRSQNREDALLNRGPALLLLFGTIIHVVIFFITKADNDILLVAVRCLLPAAAALITGGMIHQFTPDSGRECIGIVIAYLAAYLVTGIFSSALVSILALVIGLAVLFAILRHFGDQMTMEMEAGSAFGDSREVRRLYKKGYRPTGKDANINLYRHGVNPYSGEVIDDEDD